LYNSTEHEAVFECMQLLMKCSKVHSLTRHHSRAFVLTQTSNKSKQNSLAFSRVSLRTDPTVKESKLLSCKHHESVLPLPFLQQKHHKSLRVTYGIFHLVEVRKGLVIKISSSHDLDVDN